MPPRLSSYYGDSRGGPPRGGHPGGANRGSQPGGPSSANQEATPTQITPSTTTSPSQGAPNTSSAHPPSNRGRGRGRGANRGGTTGETANTTTSQSQSTRGRGGRGRGHQGTTHDRRGGAPVNPSSTATPVPSTPATTEVSPTASRESQTPVQGRGGHRGTRGNWHDRRGGMPASSTVTTSATTEPSSTANPFQDRSSRGGPGGHRGRARGTRPFRGGYPSRGGGGGGGGSAAGGPDVEDSTSIPDIAEQGFGTGGLATNIIINAFPTTVPDGIVYQYDVVHNGKLPARLNMELLRALQEAEPTTFTPKVVYDGQKIIFSRHELELGPTQSRKFSVSRPRSNGGPPKLYDILLTLVTTINSELLRSFTDRDLSHNENVSTILAALNVAVKMGPNQIHPFNKRSFYIPDGRKDIGGGIELWRGIFQSVRATIGRLFVNIDLSTGMMYKEGNLLNLCMDFFGRPPNTSPNAVLAPGTRSFREIERIRLQKFLSGVRVRVATTGDRERVVRGLSKLGADKITFETEPGVRTTVAQYFRDKLGMHLAYPSVICVLVGRVAMVPLELCTVSGGQLMRKEIPDDKVRAVLEFSTKKPQERLESIKDGLRYLQYGQSEYVRNFGMTIEENPLGTKARTIDPPKLKYNEASREPSIKPKDGAWNMIDKKFYEPSKIVRWVVVIYDSQRFFDEQAFKDTVTGFLKACGEVGIKVDNPEPIYKFEDGQGPIHEHLKNAVNECQRRFKEKPTLIVVVLPNGGGEIYNKVKHFGDITFGIPTQCLKASVCKKARSQYWNNVMLKVNVKLGGINVIPDPSSLAAEALTDPANPTIVMGADVAHPPPGVNRPSYTAIIGSVDAHTAKYVATSRAQTGNREIINDMKEMCKTILSEYRNYRVDVEKNAFKLNRLIFYRDGVSESQFKQVLELELPMIQAACDEFGVNPKITLIIVGKRHHIQFFPMQGKGDISGNCKAGTVVDRDVTHPTDHDFYLLSHAGILGTSRPAHYSVLYDDSGFNADALQSLSFSLCHVYAPSTRSVSIPAPVYYADQVCSRAKTHFDPEEHLRFDTATNTSGSTNLEAFEQAYMPLHSSQQKAMYFV